MALSAALHVFSYPVSTNEECYYCHIVPCIQIVDGRQSQTGVNMVLWGVLSADSVYISHVIREIYISCPYVADETESPAVIKTPIYHCSPCSPTPPQPHVCQWTPLNKNHHDKYNGPYRFPPSISNRHACK